MQKLKIIGIIVLTVLGIVIIVQNTESVSTRLLFVTISMPRAALLLITMMIGVCIGLFSALFMVRRKTKEK